MIGLRHPDDRHSGEVIADIFLRVLDEFGITHLLFTITADNASSNATMAREIERRAGSCGDGQRPYVFNAVNHLISCIGHVVNLAAQVLIKEGLRSQPFRDDVDVEQLDMNHDMSNIITKLRVGIKKIRYVI